MERNPEVAEVHPVVVHLPTDHALTDDQFFELCQRNPDHRIERTAEGELVIMPPAGSESGGRNFTFNVRLGAWAERDGTGKGFDSSAGFRLPNGAVRAPDAAWVRLERWERLTREEREKFAPLCPDFVVEILSPTDRLEDAQAKMSEYMDNGALLGWLLDPTTRRVFIYRPGIPVEVLDRPARIAADPVLPGFVLELNDVL